MVRKKVASSTVDEPDKNHNAKKTKKKSATIDDDEYMVAEGITEDTEVLLEFNSSIAENGEEQLVEATEAEVINHGTNIEKMKSKKQTTKKGDFNVNEALPAVSGTVKDSVETSKTKDKKGKKNSKVEDDEYALEDATSIHSSEAVDPPPEDEVPVAFLGKKKAKKNKDMKKTEETEERTADLDSSHALSTAPDVFAHTDDSKLQVTSTPNQGKGGRDKGFDLLEEESEYTLTELNKPSVSTATVESEHLDGNYEDDLQFAGKKKGKKPKKPAIAKLSDFDDLEAILTQVGGKGSERNSLVESHVNEKQISAQVLTHSSLELDDDEVLQFTGKKKGKKGKITASKIPGDDDDYAALPEVEVSQSIKETYTVEVVPSKEEMLALGSAASEDVAATSKKKLKKGKKGGRTVQEEEDLDAILAELDGPKFQNSADIDKIMVPDDYIQPSPSEDVEGTNFTSVSGLIEIEEVVESAAAKKKKKKKEKEKAKSAVVEKHGESAVQEQKEQYDEPPKPKVTDKKVPKHVREMQERLAKMKEAEEKRKREEEEKRKKEEEELQRLEELERQKEDAKRRRKEREKEKLQQKKLEGKLLTGKQKEEARRLAMMREQFLAQKGISGEGELVPKKEVAVPKKPKYDTKRKKRLPVTIASTSEDVVSQADNAQEPELLAADVVDEVVTESISEEAEEVAQDEKIDAVEEEEEEEEEDWDAKSWEASINLPAIKSAFAEEDGDFARPPSKTGKQTKTVVIQPSVAVAPTSSSTQTSLAAKPLQQKTSQNMVELGSEDETESEDDTKVKRRRDAKEKREARKADALKNRSADDLRSPICCILGHVDTGKTKLLDCIRRTNVQEGEAGGITQQIGATYFPMDNIRERTKELKADAKLRVPGLLVIDTPGHESFTNLRARGSSLCDIAILVIDIMHGLEPQTIESLNLLKLRQTPFVVALNKVDRLYGWKPCIGAPIKAALKQQTKDVVSEFETRLSQIVTQLKEQGMNSELYYRNKELRKYISIVPTSAISGEGIPDLLLLLVQLTQKLMEDKLMYVSELQCTVLEVKVVEGLGTTIDVVLVNGVLHEGDQIVVCGMQGPIVTSIRALLTPHPMKELRVKGTYQHHKELKAAQGIKITAQGLEHAIAGTQLYVVGPDDELEDIKEEAMQDMKSVMSRVDKSGEGVCVQASTLGSLEALLEYLKSPAVKIPVSGISIGPVHKKDVMRASVMLEKKKKEYATILAFDVKVTPEAKELAEELGVKIFMADIIYHLFDQFTAYMNNVKEDKRKGAAEEAVFPCVLKILPLNIFNKKDPIVVGVDVLEGIAKVGTPLCVPSRENIDIGRIASLEINHKVVETAKKGQSVAMKIVGTNAEETQKMFGRHFDENDELVSRITRNSIDLLKESYRDDLSIEEWRLVVKLKKLFEIS